MWGVDCKLQCAVVVYVVVVSGVCMCACGQVGMSYIALCSGADVKYINVSNLHRLQCIYIQGMSLQNVHSVILICHAEFQYGPNSYPANILAVA